MCQNLSGAARRATHLRDRRPSTVGRLLAPRGATGMGSGAVLLVGPAGPRTAAALERRAERRPRASPIASHAPTLSVAAPMTMPKTMPRAAPAPVP